jgi:hypothetical protein
MSRESRLVAVLLVISGIGVSGLMVVANQYRKTLAAQPAATPGARTRAIDATMNAVRLGRWVPRRTGAGPVVSIEPSGRGRGARRARRSREGVSERAEGDFGASRHDLRRLRRRPYGLERLSGGRAMSDAALAGAFAARRAALDAVEPDADAAWDDTVAD